MKSNHARPNHECATREYAFKGYTLVEGPWFNTLTTLGLGGRAIALLKLRELEILPELPAILAGLAGVNGEARVLGRGSNILVTRQDPMPLVVLRPEFGPPAQDEIRQIKEDGEQITLLRVSGALRLPALLNKAAELGLAGLAGLAGVPGNVGGSIAMNAGSYGVEVGAALREVTAFAPEFGFRTFSRADLEGSDAFGYRRFTLPLAIGEAKPKWFIITEAVFALRTSTPAEIRLEMQNCLQRKKRTQPVHARCAGCVFKNPVDRSGQSISAGLLLERAGFKGKSNGDVMFSELHANFLINHGQGRSEEAMELLDEARAAVLRQSGIKLEFEVKLWP